LVANRWESQPGYASENQANEHKKTQKTPKIDRQPKKQETEKQTGQKNL
jgi:hypothetical protein